jgi:hypothetical protein
VILFKKGGKFHSVEGCSALLFALWLERLGSHLPTRLAK